MGYSSRFIKADTRSETSGNGYISATSIHELVTVSDIVSTAASAVERSFSAYDQHIILPISGAVQLAVNGQAYTIASEELLVYCPESEDVITIQNPFDDVTVNFLHIVIKLGAHTKQPGHLSKTAVEISAKNKLFRASGSGSHLQVGIYDSRVKDSMLLQQGTDSIYTYIINGSFDFEDRLMEHRDGLFQWDLEGAEFEALSDTAVILIIECSLTK